MPNRDAVMVLAPWALALLLLLAGCSSKRPLPGDDAPTLASLAGRRVAVTPDDGPPRDDARAVAAYRDFLAAAPAASPHRAPAQRRLADLEMELADQRSADGQPPDYRSAITLYQAWLAGQPKAEGRDAVLYQLARAQEQGGELDAALATLDRLVAAHPASAHRDEAEFRRGELLFSARRWADAEAAYATVLQAGAGNPWLDRALYMQGWSRYRQGRWNDALESLFGVLDLKLGDASPDTLSRAEQELVDDSLRVTALSLEQLQGAAAIDAHVQSERRRTYAWRVYDHLATLYQRQGRVRDATDAYQRFAQSQPLTLQAAKAQQRVIELQDAAGFNAQALQARRDFVLAHAPGSDWARATEPSDEVQRWWRDHVDTLARHHHAQAQRTQNAADVDDAHRWYRLALDHGDPARRGERRFLLAELLFDAGRFEPALAAYDDAAYGDADHARRADAAYAGLLSRDRLLATRTEPTAQAALQRAQIQAAQRFAQRFDSDPRATAVLAHAAERQWALNDGPAAQQLARQVLGRADADIELRRRAHAVLADVAMAARDHAGAEQAYAQVLALLPTTDAAAQARYAERLATAIYRQGEAERDAGRPADAARHFARVGSQAPGSTAAPAALYDGALQRMALKDWPAATRALEALRQQHPQHALARSAVPQLALAYAESGRPRDAAVQLERWADGLADAAAARAARWQAAELFDRAGDASRAAPLYQRAQADAASPLPQVVQARWRLAELARTQGKPKDELALLRALQQADAQGGDARTERTRTLAARAMLRLAEPLLAAYRQVALVEPLKATLARKKTRFDAVQAAYAEAAAAGSAEAQAAATAHSAALYQDFGRAVLGSQKPRGLKKADAESYQVLLEEQAYPFEEKAVELHRANAERTRQGQYDEWVRQSYAALAVLRPLRWGKRERPTDAGTSSAARWTHEGLAHREVGRFDDARQAYERALADDPQHVPARLNLAILLDLYLHQPAAALVHFKALPPGSAGADLPRWVAELESRLPRQAVVAVPEPRR